MDLTAADRCECASITQYYPVGYEAEKDSMQEQGGKEKRT